MVAPARARPQLLALTGIRFWAASLVVLLHARHELTALPAPLQALIGAGQLAVTLFFILSGFVLTYTYARPERPDTGGTHQRRSFWQARFARIYPVYLLALTLDLPLLYLLWREGGLSLRALLATVTLTPAMLQAWLPQTACVWNCPGWSLSAEAFFYLLFPLLLPAVLWARRRWPLPPLVLGLWLLSLAPLGGVMLALWPTGWRPRAESLWIDALYYGPLFRLPEFVLGMVLGSLYLERGPRVQAQRWIWTGTLLTALVIALTPLSGPELRNVLVMPGLAALVWGLAHLGPGRWLTGPASQWLGEISYGIYILHAPLYAAMKRLRAYAPQWFPGHDLAFVLLYAAALTLLASVSYVALERPARAWLRRFWQTREGRLTGQAP